MRDTLIIYSTTDGHTRKISNYISSILIKKRFVEVVQIENISQIDITLYNNFIIGASVRYGGHSKEIIKFVRSNSKLFEDRYTSFFSVNATARKHEKNTPSKNPYIKKFFDITSWKPKRAAVFAGKIDYPSYRLFDKLIIRFIMFLTNGPTDTKSTYDFTDWSQVEDYAMNILRDIEK
jgi:menaquinone-dependent protoporphyrinogen oxidase